MEEYFQLLADFFSKVQQAAKDNEQKKKQEEKAAASYYYFPVVNKHPEYIKIYI